MRVERACRDCKKCMQSAVAHAGRNTGRLFLRLMTLDISEGVMATRKKCRLCGHQLSLHGKVPVEQLPEIRQVATYGPPVVEPDIPEQVEKLAALHAKGFLTDEEFAEKKADLLSRM